MYGSEITCHICLGKRAPCHIFVCKISTMATFENMIRFKDYCLLLPKTIDTLGGTEVKLRLNLLKKMLASRF